MYDIKILPVDVLFHILQMPFSSSSLKCLPPHKTLQAVTTSTNTSTKTEVIMKSTVNCFPINNGQRQCFGGSFSLQLPKQLLVLNQ